MIILKLYLLYTNQSPKFNISKWSREISISTLEIHELISWCLSHNQFSAMGQKYKKLAIQDRGKNGRHWSHCERFLGMSSLIKFWFCCLSMTSWSSFLSILWIFPLGNFFFSIILHGHIWDECWAFTFLGCHAALYPTVCF